MGAVVLQRVLHKRAGVLLHRSSCGVCFNERPIKIQNVHKKVINLFRYIAIYKQQSEKRINLKSIYNKKLYGKWYNWYLAVVRFDAYKVGYYVDGH